MPLDYDYHHIANTYAALALLRLMGDDYSRVNRPAIINGLRELQLDDGSFRPIPAPSENDLRFVYCATAISTMLNDWSGIDREKAFDFIIQSQSYDGAFGQGPTQEGHGGSTYCAVAALYLLGRLHEISNREELIHWLVDRQISGFQGRLSKIPDTCYSWWIGASLQLLNKFDLIETEPLIQHSLECQSPIGGFSKWASESSSPDVLHTYYALCGMQMAGVEGMEPVDYALGLSQRAAKVRTIFSEGV